jgi:hypothetical protein
MNQRIQHKIDALAKGERIETSEKGNSMTPRIKSGQKHILEPATWDQCEKDDIVFCKVHGNFYTHLVLAKNDQKGLQIGNMRGGVNGWTKTVYAKVVDIL